MKLKVTKYKPNFVDTDEVSQVIELTIEVNHLCEGVLDDGV